MTKKTRWRDLTSEDLLAAGMVIGLFIALAIFAIWIFELIITRGGTI